MDVKRTQNERKMNVFTHCQVSKTGLHCLLRWRVTSGKTLKPRPRIYYIYALAYRAYSEARACKVQLARDIRSMASSKRAKKASICRGRSASGRVTRRMRLRAANAASTRWHQASTSTIEPEQLQQASLPGASCEKLIS